MLPDHVSYLFIYFLKISVPNISSKDSTMYDVSIKNLKRNLGSASNANIKSMSGVLGAKVKAQNMLNSKVIPQRKKKKKKKQIHTRPPPCDSCGKQFSRKEYLEIHMNNVHKGLKEEILCKFCDKIYTNFSNLCRHIRRHHKEKQFPNSIGENSMVSL